LDKKRQEEVNEAIKQTEEKIKKEIGDRSRLELTDLKKQLQEKSKKVDEMRDAELALRQEKRRLEEKEKDLELSVERKLDEEKKKIETDISRKEAEKYRFKSEEKEKIIKDLQKSLDEVQRKAQTGSQQLQGEVMELDLEQMLRNTFPEDKIEPVGKGVRGADVRQIVKSPMQGIVCGVILWESKRTKAWTDSWINKLKSDLRAEKANIPVIVSSVLPKEIETGMGLKNGVWICSFSLILPLAILLRKNLLDIARQKTAAQYKDQKADILYDYITGHEFRQQVEAMVEVYQEMQEQIDKEKAAYEKIWKARQGQVERLLRSTAGVVGSIQGKIGENALPVKGLELIESESSDNK